MSIANSPKGSADAAFPASRGRRMFGLGVAVLAVGIGVNIFTLNVTEVPSYVDLVTDATWTIVAVAIVAASVSTAYGYNNNVSNGQRDGASSRLLLVLPLLVLLWAEFGILRVLVSSDGLIARILGVAPTTTFGGSSATGPSVANSIAAVGITLTFAALLATTVIVVARFASEE